MMRPITVVVSVDTEEDNWSAVRTGVTVENIRRLPDLGERFRSLGIRPTFFTTYQVANVRWAAATVRDVAMATGGEVGAHLHPWNTPPLKGPEPRHFTMLNNYPPGLTLERLRTLTDSVSAGVGYVPTSFRAGRFGLGGTTVWALDKLGYAVDSSVTPLLDWRRSGGGPDYVDATSIPHRIGRDGSRAVAAPTATLMELPLTVGFTGVTPSRWRSFAMYLRHPVMRLTRGFGAVSALRIVRRVIASPETNSAREILSICRRLIEADATHLQLFFHSSSLEAGLTPFGRTSRDVERLHARMESFVNGLDRIADPVFRTVAEAARDLVPAREGPSNVV